MTTHNGKTRIITAHVPSQPAPAPYYSEDWGSGGDFNEGSDRFPSRRNLGRCSKCNKKAGAFLVSQRRPKLLICKKCAKKNGRGS